MVTTWKTLISIIRQEILFILLMAALTAAPWFWIPDGFVYTSEEPNFINYDIKLEKASTFWTRDGLGRDGDPSNQSLLIPNAIFYKIGRSLGLDPSATQKAFLSFIFLSVSLSFGIFSTLFTRKSHIRCLGLLVYLFNFYLVASFGYTAKIFQLILMPALFMITISYLKTRRISWLFLNYILLFTFQSVFTNLPTAAATISIYFFALIYHLITDKTGSVRATLSHFGILPLSSAPVILFQGIIYWYVFKDIGENPIRYAFTAIGAPLLNLFQLRGAWWEKSGHLGIYYTNLWPFFTNPLVAITVLLGTGTVLSSIFVVLNDKARSDRIISLFWLSFYLLGLGLASGLYFIPGFYSWLVQNVPGMVMFREPWAKFVPFTIFAFSVITMLALDRLSEQKGKMYLVALSLISLMVAVQSYPYISGTVIDAKPLGWKRRLVKIPNYWEEFHQWTLKQEGVLLPIPFGVNYFNSIYRWHTDDLGNTSMPMPCQMGSMNVICDNALDKFATVVKESVGKNNFSFFEWGGVDFVMRQSDLEILGDKEKLIWQDEAINSYLEPTPVYTFGEKLTIYKVKAQYVRPKVYVAENIYIENEKSKDIKKGDVYYSPKTPASLATELLTINQATASPTVKYTKVSDVQYRIELSNLNEPYVLVFSENFSRGWKIFAGDAPDTGLPGVLSKIKRIINKPFVGEESHFVANGYANGWYVNDLSKQELTLVYRSNDPYHLALLFSTATYCLALIILLILNLKSIFKHENK